MTDYDKRFYLFQRRMRDAGLPELFIETFAYYYHQLLAGGTGLISDRDIEPAGEIVHMLDLPNHLTAVGKSAMPQTVLIKLNGGLGTSMGLQQAKSLLVVKDGLTFLDIIAEQATFVQVPLILMNSFATEAESVEALSHHEGLITSVPQTFLQHMEPKVRQADYLPVDWPPNPELAWCPPGHGDIYTALVTQGVLEKLLDAGYRYAFVSNADNLGATLNPTLLGHFVERRLPFMMEVAERSESDRKGGHLARRVQTGRLLLRELAQCPLDELDSFQDIAYYSHFNTNNLWLDLSVLKLALQSLNYNLQLPMIRNSKTVDPLDRESTPVYQLETAMGSAIEVFEGAEAIVVPRGRFAPVKKTSDLLIVRSDVFVMADDFSLDISPERLGAPPVVELDPRYYQFVDEFDQRFFAGPPSMIRCDSLTIRGDFRFGRDVTIEGEVGLFDDSGNGNLVPDGTVLSGEPRPEGGPTTT